VETWIGLQGILYTILVCVHAGRVPDFASENPVPAYQPSLNWSDACGEGETIFSTKNRPTVPPPSSLLPQDLKLQPIRAAIDTPPPALVDLGLGALTAMSA